MLLRYAPEFALYAVLVDRTGYVVFLGNPSTRGARRPVPFPASGLSERHILLLVDVIATGRAGGPLVARPYATGCYNHLPDSVNCWKRSDGEEWNTFAFVLRRLRASDYAAIDAQQ